MVEVDVQGSAGGAVVRHDDVLPDSSCLAHLPRETVRSRFPAVPTLEEALDEVVRREGVAVLDLKAPSPLADPEDRGEERFVEEVAGAIRATGAEDRVVLESFSPAILEVARERLPPIPRVLALSPLQLLSLSTLRHVDGRSIRPCAKRRHLGLTWAEVGQEYRLPGYGTSGRFLEVARLVGASGLSVDFGLLAGDPSIVLDARNAGMTVIAWTASSRRDWEVCHDLGVDGIVVDLDPIDADRTPRHLQDGHTLSERNRPASFGCLAGRTNARSIDERRVS